MKRNGRFCAMLGAVVMIAMLCGSAWADIAVIDSAKKQPGILGSGSEVVSDLADIKYKDANAKIDSTASYFDAGVTTFYDSAKDKTYAVVYSYDATKTSDVVQIFDTSDWSQTATNKSDSGTITNWGNSLRGAAFDGRYLYFASYENPNQQGKITKVDTSNYSAAPTSITFPTKTESSSTFYPHVEHIIYADGYIYACVDYSTEDYSTYAASEVYKLTSALDVASAPHASVGKNSGQSTTNGSPKSIAYHNGDLYVATIGGKQNGTYLDVDVDTTMNGALHVVNTATMKASQVLDGDISITAEDDSSDEYTADTVGYYGISIAKDGTVYLLASGVWILDEVDDEDDEMATVMAVFKTTTSGLSKLSDKDIIGSSAEYGAVYTAAGILDERSGVYYAKLKNLVGYLPDGTAKTFDAAAIGPTVLSFNLFAVAPLPDPNDQPIVDVVTPTAPVSDTTEYPTDVVTAGASTVNVVTAVNFDTATLVASTSKLLASFDVVDGASSVSLNKDVANEIVSGDASLVDPATESMGQMTVIPTIVGELGTGNEGKTLVMAFAVSGDKLNASTGAEIKLAKFRNDGHAYQLTQVASKSLMSDGSFSVVTGKGEYLGADEAIASSDTYTINVAIKDGGDNDIDGAANSQVVDPLGFYSVIAKAPEDPKDPKTSSGACDLGSGALVLALAALMLRRRPR